MCYWSNFLKKYSNETYKTYECNECYKIDHFEGIWICYISDTYFWWALWTTDYNMTLCQAVDIYRKCPQNRFINSWIRAVDNVHLFLLNFNS